ncbi:MULTISPECIES: SGNH/GDSL hydrolase family protein [unclassified Lacticaseibacillus]|uniref:SGNH/GDSL hydrolase family protein n=1 Tax=unclassified Lacticaseibacillus TaxID=2759744 RepID=UPI0019454A1B|nr:MULTISPECIES: SGNH/GDSL hydrolase family protein [unclassified Lacticaseibacillus]
MRKTIGGFMIIVISVIMIAGLAIIGNQREQTELDAQSAGFSRIGRNRTSSAKVKASNHSVKAKTKLAKTVTYAAMGDDIAAGHYTATEKGAYPYLVAADLRQSQGFTVTMIESWQAGATIGTRGLPSIDQVAEGKPDVVSLQYGNNEQTAAGSSASLYQANLTKAVSQLKAKLPRVKVILITPWRQQVAYQRAVLAVGKATGSTVVDISAIEAASQTHATVSTKSWAGTPRGDWPNDRGNVEIAHAVAQVISKLYK